MYRYLPCRLAASLVLYVLLASPVRETEGCTCIPAHPQRQYCDASFVIRGRVISKESPYSGSTASSEWPQPSYDSPQLTYTIHVQRVYKGKGIVTPRQKVQITTEADSGRCGATGLRENGRYVIMGTAGTAGSLTTGYCEYIEEWSGVSKVHRQGLSNHWNKYCGDCKAVSCAHGYCTGETTGHDVCVIHNAFSAGCEIDFARCRRDGRGRCVWRGGQPYNDCVEARPEGSSVGVSYFHYY